MTSKQDDGSPPDPANRSTKRKPEARRSAAKRETPPSTPDPDTATADHLLRNPEGWQKSVLKLRLAAGAAEVPAPFAALGVMRCVMDGLLHLNQVMSGTWALPLPEDGRLVQYATPPSPDDPARDPFAGRHPNDLVPIPLWVAVYLAGVHTKVTAELADRDEGIQRAAANVDLNRLFGVAGDGKGNSSFLHQSVTQIRARKMATAVWMLVSSERKSTVGEACEIVARIFARSPRTILQAWHDEKEWAEHQMAAGETSPEMDQH